MQFLAIVFLCIAAAMFYGILHDQVTARICVEYFTIAHPPVFNTEDPTLLALGWGVIATWWVGYLLGVPLACFARLGRYPKLAAKDLLRPLGWLMLFNFACALVAGTVGYLLGLRGMLIPTDWLAAEIPQAKHPAFWADAFAHESSYDVGFLGGLVLMAYVYRRRMMMAHKL